MWAKRVLAGKPIPCVRRALAAHVASKGATPAELLNAKYERMKAKLAPKGGYHPL